MDRKQFEQFVSSLDVMPNHTHPSVKRNYRRILAEGFRCNRKLGGYEHPDGWRIQLRYCKGNYGPFKWAILQPNRQIWARIGCTLTGSAESIEALLKGLDDLSSMIKKGKITINVDGDSYIPDDSVDVYNETYNTNHEVKDYYL